MKQLMQLEDLTQMALAIAVIYYVPVHLPALLWPVIFLAPDLSMLGYLAGNKAGAITYNLAHHKMTAGIVICIGCIWNNPALLTSGLILWSHSSFDRLLGYGLKYSDSFHHTHLGMIGKKRMNTNK